MSKTICHRATGLLAGFFLVVNFANGAETTAKFLGANSCASCHGGGAQNRNEFLTWSLKDFHSQRPVATLTTARAKQIADALGIKDPMTDVRCTTCHAPLHQVPENLRGENFKVSEGVSCESCHGPAENWIRSHTRHDYTRTDRTASGMRDLQNLYVRANTCVACHQNVDADILKAGHPELIFELDGQSTAEPKHWSAEKNGNGAQAWFVGQLVALREMSWQLAQEKAPTENEINRWRGLLWVMWQVIQAENNSAVIDTNYFFPIAVNFNQSQIKNDELAKMTAQKDWNDEMTYKALSALSSLSESFRDVSVAQQLQARRAERLVLALDRLVAAQPELKDKEPVQSTLNQLFKRAQSIPDFDPKQFADALQKFSAAVGPS